MISGWSHVLHAMYKPWGAASPTYKIQHLSLFTTTFVFMMGLLLKVNGVVQQSLGFRVRRSPFRACQWLPLLLRVKGGLLPSSQRPSWLRWVG